MKTIKDIAVEAATAGLELDITGGTEMWLTGMDIESTRRREDNLAVFFARLHGGRDRVEVVVDFGSI